MSKIISLSQGFEAIVDDDDYDWLSTFNWLFRYGNINRKEFGGYAYRTHQKKRVYMHREINKTPDGFETDHINGNKLDNRKSNLRTVTHAENMRNVGPHRDGLSKYRGVSFFSNRWVARMHTKGRNLYLGCFKTEIEAAIAYNNAVMESGEPTRYLNKGISAC